MAGRARESHEDGVAGITLENTAVRVRILPDFGGRIWSLVDRRRDVDWIWHNPRVPLRRVDPGESYDDTWAGGWEQLFPNDAPGPFRGRTLPDHGEWWTRAWSAAIASGPSGDDVVLSLAGSVTETAVEKRIALRGDEAALDVHYRIANTSHEDLQFLFKEHLAVAVSPEHELELPGGCVTPVDLSFSTRIGAAGPFSWPFAAGRDGRQVDLRTMPDPQRRDREFVYVSGLPEGWCGVRRPRDGAALRMTFSREALPYVWLFTTYGGWRDLYTVVLEPCTNMPKDLSAAVAAGRCATLPPAGVFETTVAVALS